MQAIKKAKDFEIRKLKRRLRELERAEENPKDAEGEESDQSEASSSDTDSGSAEDQGIPPYLQKENMFNTFLFCI